MPKSKKHAQLEENRNKYIANKFKDFYYKDKKYRARCIPLKFKEDLFNIIYLTHYIESNSDEIDTEGYIYYKPMLSRKGKLYMFKNLSTAKTAKKDAPRKKESPEPTNIFSAGIGKLSYLMKSYLFGRSSKGKAEIHIALNTILIFLPYLILIGIGIYLYVMGYQ
ncbi:MAG: hypothetical protein BEN19_01790 [Epulopiscium sp. Nuni2H_MBin003]|nr:MAG: hypothetical protein BEN19_01790 [Epulopiscium sp. Nuni2H_MBin003]